MKLRATILQTGKAAAGIRIPAAVVTALGGNKRPAVRVTINRYTYRTSIATMAGHYMLPVSVQVRGEAGVAAGDEVDLQLEFDTAPRAIESPGTWRRRSPAKWQRCTDIVLADSVRPGQQRL